MDASAFTCIPCEKVFTGPEPFRLHVASAKHKRKILAGSFVCEDCRMTFNGPAPLRDHMASERHAKKARVSSASDAVASAQCSSDGAGVVASNGEVGCPSCNISSFPTLEAACNHYESEEHRDRKKLMQTSDPGPSAASPIESVPPVVNHMMPEIPQLPASVLICRAEEDFADFCKRNNLFS
ncbi:uncharacterized protein LOC144163178 isoform X1 [Haemaphysalis longicornis]